MERLLCAAVLCLATSVALSGCASSNAAAGRHSARDAVQHAPMDTTAAGRLRHLAIGAKVFATSTHMGAMGEGPAGALVDGDLFTRWSSHYTDPHEVTLLLRRPTRVERIRLHWETAAAVDYKVSVSVNGRDWIAVATEEGKRMGPRIDEVAVGRDEVIGIRLDLTKRVKPDWGFSLYEVEVLGH